MVLICLRTVPGPEEASSGAGRHAQFPTPRPSPPACPPRRSACLPACLPSTVVSSPGVHAGAWAFLRVRVERRTFQSSPGLTVYIVERLEGGGADIGDVSGQVPPTMPPPPQRCSEAVAAVAAPPCPVINPPPLMC